MNANRRSILKAGAASGALAVMPVRAAARAAEERTVADERLHAMLSRHLQEELLHSPQKLTSLGLDTGRLAWARGELPKTGLAAEKAGRARLSRHHAEIMTFPRDGLSAEGERHLEVAAFKTASLHGLSEQFAFGVTRGPYFTPYVVTQLTGAWYEIPDFLDKEHPISDEADAEAYLRRLSAFADMLDGESERIAHDAELGVTPPDFMIERTVSNLRGLRDEPPSRSRLVQSLAERSGALGLKGYEKRAEEIFVGTVRPALSRQVDALMAHADGARHDAGCYALPQGETVYRLGLLDNTTRALSGEEVHELGLSEVASIHRELDAIMAEFGYDEGSVGERLGQLNEDPRFAFSDSDEGRDDLLAYVRGLVGDIERRLPAAFSAKPETRLVVQRIPPAIENGAPGGYYTAAPLDGTRPASYNINLKDVSSWSKWSLPALTHHEAVPGHHLQIGLLRESAGMPLYRRLTGFTAYSEGWALYAEKVARELGAYEKERVGLIGQLQSQLFRAVRLVVDSGIHHKRWSREKAIRYMMEEGGEPEASAIGEIERYAVWPGNACAYKVGEITMSRLRREAEAALKGRFDIKAFHDRVLGLGPVPLPVLEKAVAAYIAEER